MTVSFSPLVPIIFVRPLTSIERVKRNPVDRMPQIFITGKAKMYDMTFATRFGYGDSSPLGLKVAKGLPAILGIAQLSPKLGYGGPAFSSRQALYKLSCRHRGEKTFDLLAVAFHRWQQGLKLNHQRQQKFRFGSNHVWGTGQLRLIDLIPKLITAGLAEMMVALGKVVPAPAGKLRESLRSWILFEKIPRYVGLQIRKNLQWPRIVSL